MLGGPLGSASWESAGSVSPDTESIAPSVPGTQHSRGQLSTPQRCSCVWWTVSWLN